MIVPIFLVMGGIGGPLLHWVALLPMVAVLIGEKRTACIWATVSCLLVAGLAAADINGVPMPNYW